MNDKELEDAVQKIYQGELEYYREIEMEDMFYERHELQPPATEEDITACEQSLGRVFSPSYRHFLRLHDGWKGFYHCAGFGPLYGTHHYRFDHGTREDFALIVYVDLLWGLRTPEPAPIPDQPHPLYYPENYYHFIDGKRPDPDGLKAARELINTFDETRRTCPIWKHTLIGSETHYRLFLDTNTLRPDGEMEVVEQIDTNSSRWENFYEFMRDRASSYK